MEVTLTVAQVQRHEVIRAAIGRRMTNQEAAAARAGVLARVGEFVLFADSGLCVPFRDARLGLELIRAGECAVAPGSRRLPA
ncbi:MAG: hypothetical protein R6V58_15540, partial [Planctomycetota bacterium]